jgi:NitT/TauT family transport system ATP-binding protein
MTSHAVVLRKLTMTFPTIAVLDGIDLQIAQGEFVVIVGPSGCGKSTILNILGGFQKPTGGEVLVGGEAVVGPDPRRIFVFQENAVFPWMNVWENIGFGLGKQSKPEKEATIARYVEMVGLRGFERTFPRDLSGGMRQRVELARALAANPEILWMDEPFGALDYLTRLKMRADLVRIWQQEKKTIVFVTHDIDEAVQLADRVVVLTTRPATIAEIVAVKLGRPRDQDSGEYLRARDRIFAVMGNRELVHGEANCEKLSP